MTADDDIGDAKAGDRVLDTGRDASRSHPVGRTMFPALRMTNSSPGSCCVSSSGMTRLSEQAMNRVRGFWVVARCLNSFVRLGNSSR